MKKVLLLSCFILAGSFAFAQSNIDSNDKTAVGTDVTSSSTLGINTSGDANSEVIIESSKSNALTVVRKSGTTSESWGRAVNAGTPVTPGLLNSGVTGFSYSPSAINSGRAFGMIAIAGNCTPGYNYGVLGMLFGTNDGAGVYGTSVHNDYGIGINGRYAGYFRGNVHVTGSISGILLTTASTQGNTPLLSTLSSPEENTTSKLAQLNMIQYNFQSLDATLATMSEADTLATPRILSQEEAQIYSKAHYGLIAQELKDVYPDLVYENAQGELSINYIEMIPLLVQSIQELTTEINNLKSDKPTATTQILDEKKPELFQNLPNPFTSSTEIRYCIPTDAKTATLYIYDMNGKQINEFPISQKGEGVINLQGNRMEAGMYLYSLLIDGKLIDVKRMVLTK